MELKTCTKCGDEKPIDEFGNKKLGRGGKDPWCKVCHNLYGKAWAEANRDSLRRKQKERYKADTKQLDANRAFRKANPERSRAYGKKWRAANKEKVKARKQRWIEKNPGRTKEVSKRWYEAHKLWVAERSKKWKVANQDRIRERVRNWQKNNLAKLAQATREYRNRKKGVPGSHTIEEWLALCKKFKNRCVRCGKKRKLEADHIVPLTKPGSTDNISNIQPLCRTCNCTKGNRDTIDYRGTPFTGQGQGRLLG